LYNVCKVWEACRATSAATTFFDPITIGPRGQNFVDGGILYNNPVELVYREAQDLWPDRNILLVSVGTGSAPGQRFDGHILDIVNQMKNLVTETERTANDFLLSHRAMEQSGLYYRFNVYHTLADVGLEEYKEVGKIADATEAYLDSGETGNKAKACIQKLSGACDAGAS
jgi:predicted acylesterase/phospholipase RssA